MATRSTWNDSWTKDKIGCRPRCVPPRLSGGPPMLSSTLGMRSHISLPWKLDRKQKNSQPRNFRNPELFQNLACRGTRWQSAGRMLGKAFLELVRRRSQWRGLEPASRAFQDIFQGSWRRCVVALTGAKVVDIVTCRVEIICLLLC